MKLLHGCCLVELAGIPSDSIDSVVTDPPYGWRFMGKAWDGADIEKTAKQHQNGVREGKSLSAGLYDNSLTANKAFELWTAQWAKEAFRVLKPGGHMLVFCGPRTYHRMASGVEDAGFEIRDQLQWLFGSGFPKSMNLGNGWGTALKPANEPIVLARKPISEKTVAANVLKWGTGGINVDGCRVEGAFSSGWSQSGSKESVNREPRPDNPQGRFPANLILDEEAGALLDLQSGLLKSGAHSGPRQGFSDSPIYGNGKTIVSDYSASIGGASRFFYCAKASKSERNAGCEGLPVVPQHRNGAGLGEGLDPMAPSYGQNHHPTVKPIKLMEYLCKLITPLGGTILDPFMGSGSTGVAAKKLGFGFVGIEREAEYVAIAKRRIG